ncbi:MAG: hypothetical protein Rsou_1042 [Candidatus Ruthia sp. Asou_11_S2]|nr:hypothetical protein [Candidatus Ruthia sp. Asou_11_S2]
MSISIRVNENLYSQAKIQAKAELRTVPNQIEYWARVGHAAMDNPDLPIDMVEKLLIAKREANQPFEFIG